MDEAITDQQHLRSLLMKGLIFVALFLLAMGGEALGQCPTPNPNISAGLPGNLFVDKCPLPASGLNNLAQSIATKGNVNGPTSATTVGHVPLFNNATGSLLADSATISGGGIKAALSLSGALTINTQPNNMTVSFLNSMSVQGGAFIYLPQAAQNVVSNTWGEMAIVGASFSSGNIGTGQACCSMGVAGVAINDNTVISNDAWAGYFSAVRGAGIPGPPGFPNGGGGTRGLEVEIANEGLPVIVNPYSNFTGESNGLLIGCGGEPASVGITINPCSTAIEILKSQSPGLAIFGSGILVGPNAIQQNTATQRYPAIQLPSANEIEWWLGTGSPLVGNLTAAVFSAITNPVNAMQIAFRDGGTFVEKLSAGAGPFATAPMFGIAAPSGTQPDYILVTAGAAVTNPPTITTQGADPNVNMNIFAKGSGTISVNSPLILSVPVSFSSTISSSGSLGVSCSGTPTSSYASVNGIVTHC
jgi:hypothetical protein